MKKEATTQGTNFCKVKPKTKSEPKPTVKQNVFSSSASKSKSKEKSESTMQKKQFQNGKNNTSTRSHPKKYLHSMHYGVVLNRLMKYLKKNLSKKDYSNIKSFVKDELNNSLNSTNLNDSLSSIFKDEQKPNNVFVSSIDLDKKDEKNLKLSYDLSTLVSSPKNNQPTKINSNTNSSNFDKITNIVQVSNVQTISYSNSQREKTQSSLNSKDVHSLYTIVKGGSNQKSQNKLSNKTQMNSKSKSKSTSREKSIGNQKKTNLTNYLNHHPILSEVKISTATSRKTPSIKQTMINKSQPFLNQKLFSKINITTNGPSNVANNSSNNSNNIHNIKMNQTKVTNQNLLRGKKYGKKEYTSRIASSKTKSNPSKQNSISHQAKINEQKTPRNVNCFHQRKVGNLISKKGVENNIHTKKPNQSNKAKHNTKLTNQGEGKKYVEEYQDKGAGNNNCANTNTITIVNSTANKGSKTKEEFIDLSEKDLSPSKKAETVEKIKKLINKSNNVKIIGKVKNEEMIKQIKNTLDDNLKVMFNFSYENFLSKESESESKKSSQQELFADESN